MEPIRSHWGRPYTTYCGMVALNVRMTMTMTETAQNPVGNSMLVIRRITSGIVNHFPIRKSEWGMGIAAAGMAIVLRVQPDMFESTKTFVTMDQIATEMTWGLFAVSIFIIRLLALGVNGTFEGFGYSPHLRLIASVAGLLFWAQFVLGVLISAYYHGGAMSAIVAYGTFCFFEGCNIVQSASDKADQSRRN